jgi:hypothetical protein
MGIFSRFPVLATELIEVPLHMRTRNLILHSSKPIQTNSGRIKVVFNPKNSLTYQIHSNIFKQALAQVLQALIIVPHRRGLLTTHNSNNSSNSRLRRRITLTIVMMGRNYCAIKIIMGQNT